MWSFSALSTPTWAASAPRGDWSHRTPTHHFPTQASQQSSSLQLHARSFLSNTGDEYRSRAEQASAELLEITTCLAVVALFSNSSQHKVHRGCSSAVGRPCVYTAMIKRLITLEQWAALSDEREMYTTYGWLNLLWCECVCLGCILACRHLSSCVYKFTATLQNDVFLLVLLALHYGYTAV